VLIQPPEPDTRPPPTEAAAARFRQRARRCYERALSADPNMQGRVTVRIEIDADGLVTAVRAESDAPSLRSMLPCLESAARSAFAPRLDPVPGAFTLTIQFVRSAAELPGEK
jgi:hypothetical protein